MYYYSLLETTNDFFFHGGRLWCSHTSPNPFGSTQRTAWHPIVCNARTSLSLCEHTQPVIPRHDTNSHLCRFSFADFIYLPFNFLYCPIYLFMNVRQTLFVVTLYLLEIIIIRNIQLYAIKLQQLTSAQSLGLLLLQWCSFIGSKMQVGIQNQFNNSIGKARQERNGDYQIRT